MRKGFFLSVAADDDEISMDEDEGEILSGDPEACDGLRAASLVEEGASMAEVVERLPGNAAAPR